MKARNKVTGVLLDVTPKTNPDVRSMGDNLYVGDGIIYRESELDFVNIEIPINWEQRRYEIAKTVLQGIWSQNYIEMTMKEVAEKAIEQADVLISELRKEEK